MNLLQHNNFMKTKYNIYNNELIVNLDFLYEFIEKTTVSNIRKYINNLIKNNNINFHGNKIIVYKNGILIGTFYLTSYYLTKCNFSIKDDYLTNYNNYFQESYYLEINTSYKIKKEKILNLI